MDLSSLLRCLTLFYSHGYIRYSLNTNTHSRYGLQHETACTYLHAGTGLCTSFYSGSFAEEVTQNINFHKPSFLL